MAKSAAVRADQRRAVLLSESSASSPHLIHPLIDFLMVGGLSIIFFAFIYLFIGKSESTFDLGWTMFYLTFAINSPHFLISYLHFYVDHRKKLTRHWKWFGVAFVVPAVLVGWVTYGALAKDMHWLGYTVNAMFFFVGWHYVKQIFGCFTVFSSRAGYSPSGPIRRALKANLFSLWGLSYFNGNLYVAQNDFYSLKYATIAMPAGTMNAVYVAVVLSGVWALWTIAAKYIEDGTLPPLNAWVSWFTIYVWYIPAIYHPAYFLMIPAFHSLQYLLFSTTYTFNRVAREAVASGKTDQERRKYFVRDFLSYLALAVILGALCFDLVPKFFDRVVVYDGAAIGATFFLAAFNLFINIHHYFIDHLIWRGNLPEVRQNLLGKEA